jgi:phosphopantothenoylcysteine decarboxylase/phosphopantothenate--cysteine ligase
MDNVWRFLKQYKADSYEDSSSWISKQKITRKKMLKEKKIVLGITGSIAAYKSCLIIREFVKQGAEVQVVITPAGKEFITPITLSALTHKPVISEFFSQRDGTWNSHVDLGLWADAMVIAPATAATIGKMANGVADNMLITTYLSMKAPVFIAPAMDLDMFAHPSTQRNLKTLESYGNHIIQPQSGFLASGLEGKGRMEEPSVIVNYVKKFFEEEVDNNNSIHRDLSLKGKRVMITAGPTYEKIDPVRFIGNYSSGKMGFALAEECRKRGADVTLISGPVSLSCSLEINRIDVESCEDMYKAANENFSDSDITILCAAVADFKPETTADKKIKREKDDLVLRLQPTHDIAASLGKKKRENQIMVGFALETNDEEINAKKKLKRKNLDFIVLNSTRNPGTTFRSNDNQIEIISDKEVKKFGKKPKQEVAKDIIDELTYYI